MSSLRKIPKWMRIIGVILVLVASAYVIILLVLFSGFSPNYTKKDLTDNFEKNGVEILALKKYFNSIVPKEKDVEIEFKSNHELSRLGVASLSRSGTIIYPIFLDWNLSLGSQKLDSIIATIGWTERTLHDIKQKLDAVDCIAIHNGEPTVIGFKRSGMGMYFYNVFDQDIAPGVRKVYNDTCRYILYNDRLVLEYGGGALGSQCFPKTN